MTTGIEWEDKLIDKSIFCSPALLGSIFQVCLPWDHPHLLGIVRTAVDMMIWEEVKSSAWNIRCPHSFTKSDIRLLFCLKKGNFRAMNRYGIHVCHLQISSQFHLLVHQDPEQKLTQTLACNHRTDTAKSLNTMSWTILIMRDASSGYISRIRVLEHVWLHQCSSGQNHRTPTMVSVHDANQWRIFSLSIPPRNRSTYAGSCANSKNSLSIAVGSTNRIRLELLNFSRNIR